MAYKQPVTREFFLEKVRCGWFQLVAPDFKFNDRGTYGVGAILDEAAAARLNTHVSAVANESGEPGKTYTAGETAKLNMYATRRDKKTGRVDEYTPLVYLPDATPATKADMEKLGPRAKITVKVRARSYPPIGEGGVGGVSVKFLSMQIISFDAGAPSATEEGFQPVQDEGEEGF